MPDHKQSGHTDHTCHHHDRANGAHEHDGGAHNHPCHSGGRVDYLLWGSALIVVALYGIALFAPQLVAGATALETLTHSVFELINTMWWGVLIGIFTLSLLAGIPREFVIAALGPGGTATGVARATLAGVLLDLCSHGILMVGAKLYERGATTGQVMAFLIASPWNSLSLTLIMIALIGLPWTLAFIILSMVIAMVSGLIFEALTSRGVLPSNPNRIDLDTGFRFFPEAKQRLRNIRFTPRLFASLLWNGIKESRMVVRWILFGVILAALIRAFMPPDQFQTFFGPTLIGLGLTVVVATILEVCSEGTMPVAADILNRAGAPGNGFAFLMSGVATDYTEIMVLRDATKLWKIPLFLPLVTLPQVLLIAWLMNMAAG